MTSSNLLSRFLPSATGSPSIYETIEQHERAAEESDTEDHVDAAIDEENLEERFHDQDLDHLLAEAAESQITGESTAFLSPPGQQRGPRSPFRGRSRPRWMNDGGTEPDPNDDDDVPESLLLEEDRGAEVVGNRNGQQESPGKQELPLPVPGPSRRSPRIQWNTARARTRSNMETRSRLPRALQQSTGLMLATPEQKAMWRWTNVENLDNFLNEVYQYYVGKGIWSITLEFILKLGTYAFIGILLLFLTSCVNYRLIPQSKSLSQVVVPQCTRNMSGLANVIIWVGSFAWILRLYRLVVEFQRLRHMQDFYHYVLGIPDDEMQTISWQVVVGRLMTLRDSNPQTAINITPRTRRFVGEQSKQRMDAHDIANRLMRKENYLIALFNKEILDLTLPIPFLKNRHLFSYTLAWNLNYCVMDLMFNDRGQVKQIVLKDSYRNELVGAMNRRFAFAGLTTVLCIPFLVPYLLAKYFFEFFLEFQRNPSQLGTRAYTSVAKWKFREFNELPHLFERRIDMSYPFASRYIDQFPKHKTVQLAKFVAFIAGALGSVLAAASLIDPELFLGFEITADRTVLFYLGILGTIWAVARGICPQENLVFDPEYAIQEVIEFIHHRPAHWENRLHSDEVRREFASLYQPRVLIFFQEILYLICAPFLLWYNLPRCSERLVDFFREFTVHVDGLGYVCSFALFEFQKGRPEFGRRDSTKATTNQGDVRDEYYSTKDGKMLASYFGFLDSYANNPRRGAHREDRPHFHPPPSFPGVSPTSQIVEPMNRGNHDASAGPSQTISQSVYRLAGGQRSVIHGSPSPSLLLDPQHQPSVTLAKRPTRRTGQSKLREPISEYHEEAQHGESGNTFLQTGVTTSTMIAEDSHIGESWNAARMAAVGEADDEEEDDEDVLGREQGGAGVLGLLYQFQKAQTEGKVAGVSI